MAQLIVHLDTRKARREAIAGGKGAGLARLLGDGFPVPAGFVVKPQTFDSVIRQADIGDLPLWTCSEEIVSRAREGIMRAAIPRRVADQILGAYESLLTPVAVRSSMIGEDSLDRSYAGQLDSVLNVSDPVTLLQAVKRCWASTLNPRLLAYLGEHSMGEAQPLNGALSIAVVVQRMVDAKAAGVAFSADPVTGQRCVVVEATRGLGDALVAGRVTPDRYVIDGRGHLVETSCADPGNPVVADSLVVELAGLVRDVARRMGIPQDVEWAWDGTQLWLLQARPITTLVGKHVYSNRISSEMAPGLIKPLLYTTNTSSMARNVFGRVFTDLIGPNDIDFNGIGRRVHSRQYTDLTFMGELFERVGLPANFFEMMSRDEHGARRRPQLSPGMVAAGFRLLRFAVRHGWMVGEIEAFNERHHLELEPFRRADWNCRLPRELIAAYEHLSRLHGETQWHVFLGPVNMQIRNRHMAGLARKHAPSVAPGDLIKGLVGLKALEPNAKLSAMAAGAAAMGEPTVQTLAAGSEEDIRAHLAGSARGQELLSQFDAFLDEFGFLSTNGTDFTVAPWAETPEMLWRSMARLAVQPVSHTTESTATVRKQARDALRSRLNRLQRIHFDRLLRTTTRYIELRERTSMLMSEDAYQTRRIFLALADQLVDRGELLERDDIFYLEYAELCALVEGELGVANAQAVVSRRRAEMAADAEVELPDTFCGESPPVVQVSAAKEEDFLAGIAGSSGVVLGSARVIHDPAEAPERLTRDDILVVPFTDVGWTPLFAGIGGIVAETGGLLSHTAIVAREYGLPAVVSVKNATRLIRPGQPLTLDGNAGRVYLYHVND